MIISHCIVQLQQFEVQRDAFPLISMRAIWRVMLLISLSKFERQYKWLELDLLSMCVT